jgi:hypothetical protein
MPAHDIARLRRAMRHALDRRQRRWLDSATTANRDIGPVKCSHWRSCEHQPCIAARRSIRLVREADTLVNRLHRQFGD